MRFTLNGREVEVPSVEGLSLLELLRAELGLRSMKDGCAPEGSCGACTVLVDGKAVVSCAQPASRMEGKSVVTQEGLGAETRAQWARAFAVAGASQCGFCSPGIVMKTEGLLGKNPVPTRDDVAQALKGNLCRCTGYVKIVDAVLRVAAERRGEAVTEPAAGDGVGARAIRYRADELALGDKEFVADMVVPGMLHAAVRFSDHPRARIVAIDASRAEALPGVVRVVTRADVPGRNELGTIVQDWPQYVGIGDETGYIGDVVAAVAADTRAIARHAVELIDVEYEVLDPVVDPFDPRARVFSKSEVKRGDVDEALAGAAHVVSRKFRTQHIEHAFLEPEAALAVPVGEGLHVYSQGQGVWDDKRQIAQLLAIDDDKVRVTQVSSGGGFGGKEDISVQSHASLLAWKAQQPVLLVLSRKESLRMHPKRHPMWLDYTAGCDADGKLLAVRARIVGDTGAYASVGDKVLERAAGHACSAYEVPNVDVEATAMNTNNVPCGAMRGFGVNQSNFAMEGVLDQLAEAVGIDGWEIRWRNALDVGSRTTTGQVLGRGVGLKKTLAAVRDAYREARFAGIACGLKNTGIGNGVPEGGNAVIRPEADGTFTLWHSWTEMGQGVHTVFRQIACEVLGVTSERVRVLVDTERDLDTGMTTASRATVLGGNAVFDAAKRLRAALETTPHEELVGREFRGEFRVDWTTPNDAAEPVTHLAYGWATQVVVLDDEGRIEKVIAAHDVGRAINPTLLEGQIEGAVHMGLGQALSEEYVVSGGIPQTETLKSLRIIPPTGMPPVEMVIVEEPQPEGPFGAKGVGEAALVPTAAAVAGALYAFDGIRRSELPMKDSPAAVAAVPHLVKGRERSLA
ncbi:MAG TPA: selenium-dependent xanthine dehydrogenase [Gaiellaceae bacterium]